MPPVPSRLRLRAVALVLATAAGDDRPLQAVPDGDFDTSFYTDGKYVQPQLAPGFDQRYLALAEGPDGRLVAAGVRATLIGTSTLFWSALDGSSAPTLCTVFTDLEPPVLARPHAIAFDSSGRLLVAGQADFLGEVGIEGIVLRFLYPDCLLDDGFGDGGLARTNFVNDATVHAVAVDSDGRVVVGGQNGPASGFVLRFDDAGELDSTFDGDGLRPIGAAVAALDLQDDDRIVIATSPSGQSEIFVYRLDELGDFDGTFSGDGRVELDFLEVDTPVAVRVDSHRPGIVVLGRATASATLKTAIARLTPAGAFDPTLDDDGRVLGNCSGPFNETPMALDLQSDGRILITGSASDSSGAPFLCRLLPNADFDTSFKGNGSTSVPLHSAAGGHSGVSALLVRPSGRIALAGFAENSDPQVGVAAQLTNAHIFYDGFERGSTASWSNGAP